MPCKSPSGKHECSGLASQYNHLSTQTRMRIRQNQNLSRAPSMSMDEVVLEKSIRQININDDDDEGMLPRYMYKYTLCWEHLYLSNGKLIGRRGMYRNKLILQSKPMTLGDCKKTIARPGDLYCCKATQCVSGRFLKMTNDEDIVPLYKKRIDCNCIVIMYIFHRQ